MNNKICNVHNEPALYCEEDNQQNQVFLCKFCVQQKFKIQNLDNVNDEEKYQLQQLEKKFDQNIKQLENFAEVLEQFTQQVQQKLQKFKQLVEENISHIIEKKNQVKNISNNFINLQLNKINEEKNIIENSQVQIISQLNNQIKELEISTKLDQLYQLFNNQSNEEHFKLKQLENDRVFEKKFDYQLIQQSSVKQNENCFAISFNKDASIMIAGCGKVIKVFEFRNDMLRLLKQLSGHNNSVYCLQFMKKSNHFVSGSGDSTMIIWNLDQYNQIECIQALRNHTSDIFCITMNQNENVLISGSGDKTIKFWRNSNNLWSCYQSLDCQSAVYSISLNAQDDQLIASVYDKQILIIQLQDEVWMIKQNIPVEQYGFRLCHINQNQFVFQPIYGQIFQIFDYDAQDQTYKKGQELIYQHIETRDDCLFPIQYLSQIGLIIVKNGNHVHLIVRNQNGSFSVKQSINFNTHNIYGCITEDGRYISVWDNKSQEIQIGKFEF